MDTSFVLTIIGIVLSLIGIIFIFILMEEGIDLLKLDQPFG